MIGWFVVIPVFGQQRANYELAEKFTRLSAMQNMGKHSLSVYPNFLPKSNCFWFEFLTEEGSAYYFVQPEKKSMTPLFETAQLLSQVSELTRVAYSPKEVKLDNIVFDGDGRSFRFKLGYGSEWYSYDRETRVVNAVTEPEKTPKKAMFDMKYAPDSTYGIYVREHNLYMRGNLDKGTDTTEVQLTTDGERYYSFATRDDEMTTELRRSAISNWSDNSKKIQVVRTDRRKVEELYLIDAISGTRPTLKQYKFDMPGDEFVNQYELLVIDVATRKITRVQADRWKDQSLKVLYMTKDARKIYFERQKRTNDEMEICVADAETGACQVLISERDKPYLDDEMKKIVILNDGKEILLRSERTGWGHYYLYDDKGNLKTTVTSGDWVAGRIVDIDTVGRTIYFMGHGREESVTDPYYGLVYSAKLDRQEVKLIGGEDADHRPYFSRKREYFVDNYSRMDREPRSVLKDRDGNVVLELPKPDLRRLYEMGYRMPELFRVKAADGVTDLYGVMWKPADFDPNKKYPIISSVYPGPFTESVTKEFAMDDYQNTRLAQVGFIVIAVGHRGGDPLRGKWYHRYGYGNLRDYPLADDKFAIEQLADRYPYVDATRVGMFGHSGGGFMSVAALCTYPDFYKAAVASAGNHDNNMYWRSWGELYNGVEEVKTEKKETREEKREWGWKKVMVGAIPAKEENEEGEVSFKARVKTNMELAKNLKGHLLIVTGDADNNVHPGHTLRMVDALIKARKNFEMIVLPGNDHHYRGEYQVYYERRLWYHFAKYLLDDATADKFYEIKQYENKK